MRVLDELPASYEPQLLKAPRRPRGKPVGPSERDGKSLDFHWAALLLYLSGDIASHAQKLQEVLLLRGS